MSYDTKCYDLAVDFLEECTPVPSDDKFDKLAQVIQDAIEGFIATEIDPTPQEADLRGPDRNEWKHEAAEQQRLK